MENIQTKNRAGHVNATWFGLVSATDGLTDGRAMLAAHSRR